jgi:exopolysaccharide biosynthesis polyprenyl glycosylphosphotransferase
MMQSSKTEFRSASQGAQRIPLEKTGVGINTKTQWALFSLVLVISDVLMLGIAFRAAYAIRFGFSLPVFQLEVTPDIAFYQRVALLMTVVWTISFFVVGLYKKENLLGGPQEYALVFRASTTSTVLVMVASFFELEFGIARGWLVLSWLLSFLLVSLARFTLRRVAYYLREYGWFVSPALIIGANDEGILLARQLSNTRYSGLKVLGFVDKKYPVDTVPTRNLRVLGNLEHLDELISQFNVEELILASSSISSRDKLIDVFSRYGFSSDINVRMSSGLYEIITTGLKVREFAYVPLVGVNRVRMTGIDNFIKTLLDYCLTIPLLVVISPILLIIAIAIKLDSPGPVIHRRRVMGVNNKQFDAFKFRTMHVNGEEILARHPELKLELERTHKLKNDPRITRVGNLLRKTSLDELPQLFNVLLYQMSLVGPRIIHPDEMAMYAKWGINLLTVRPGITGLWQVSGRSDISYRERVRLDMHYIRNWTIWMDLQLLWRTIPAVLKSRGAY